MQSVPSLIGAGTAVAAAATGLVFGQLAGDQQQVTPHSSSASIGQKFVTDHDFSNPHAFPRPGAGSVASTAPPSTQNHAALPLRQPSALVSATPAQAPMPLRTSHAQITPAKPPSSRHSLVKQTDLVFTEPVTDDTRDSVSLSGSWIRRLSLRPLSQHGSLRSSVGPDSPSLFSFGSAAPILPASKDRPPHLPPNKLVKRAPGTNPDNAGLPKTRRSRAQMTLRRPATSHQRSATLQHQLNVEDLPALPKFSFDRPGRPRAKTVETREQKPVAGPVGDKRSRWKSFWHARVSNPAAKTAPLRGPDGTSQSSGRRLRLEEQHTHQVYLITPDKVTMNGVPESASEFHEFNPSPRTSTGADPRVSENKLDSDEGKTSNRPERSASMQLSSPITWISKAGSLRRRRGWSETRKRHVSALAVGDEDRAQTSQRIHADGARQCAEVTQAEADLAAIFRPPGSQPGPTSPLPPLSRLSSFHLDTRRLGSSSSGAADRLEESIVSPSVSSRVNSHASHTQTLERASTVSSSEYHHGFTSGDDEDDDTDLNTDTPFDSFRTVASDRKRALDNPLGSMFEDIPPTTAGNDNTSKRLSIQDILEPSVDGGGKITEEDESASTPVRGTYEEFEARVRTANIRDNNASIRVPASDFLIEGSYGRLSLDDDDDDLGWAREDDVEFYNRLSPPSSMNSRRGSPKYQTTLGRASRKTRPDVHFDSANERPRSTVFDWTEAPAHDKREKNSLTYRPKTVHGKQEMDLRGGRLASRKGFIPAHVRSQSVPIVPGLADTKKPVPKFGTWGLGQKNVSEDWDDDFEFDEDTRSGDGSAEPKNENRYSMVVPASIQATQPTVKAHSGQIRELSLLVNDLKRLCRLGREMNMFVGSSAKLWHEAEGIIALASPDEDTEATETGAPGDLGNVPIDERFIEKGFDGASLAVGEGPRHRNPPSSHRRSVFSPDDDVFGTWDQINEEVTERPMTPENPIPDHGSTTVARSVMESVRKRQATFDGSDEDANESDTDDRANRSNRKMNFDTNSLKELVKRAGDLRDSLSELIRREDHFAPSPARTPKHTRPDGSPAFTRVFDEPTSSPTRRVSHHSNNPVLSTSVSTSPSNGISRRMQVMMVS